MLAEKKNKITFLQTKKKTKNGQPWGDQIKVLATAAFLIGYVNKNAIEREGKMTFLRVWVDTRQKKKKQNKKALVGHYRLDEILG